MLRSTHRTRALSVPVRAYAAGAALVLAASLAACNGDPTPSPSPTGSSSSSGSVSPSVSPSSASPSPSTSIPAEASVQTPEGAVAFVKFYVAQVNTAWQVPNPEALRGLADDRCETCASYATSAADLVRDHQRNTGDAVEVLAAVPIGTIQDGQVLVDLSFRQLPVTTVDASGAVIHRAESSDFKARAAVTWQEGRWHMLALAPVS